MLMIDLGKLLCRKLTSRLIISEEFLYAEIHQPISRSNCIILDMYCVDGSPLWQLKARNQDELLKVMAE